MRADINTIANTCGVSKATVSRVFTGKAKVSSKVKEKILAAARELNYRPEKVISQENITIVVDHLISFNANNGFYPMILSALIAEITRNNYAIKVIEFEDFDMMLKSFTRAAVLLFRGGIPMEIMDKIESSPIPLICTNEILPNCHSVCSDHAQEVSIAFDHLYENGHRRISLVLDTEESWTSNERRRGYIEAARRHNIEIMPEHIISDQYPLFEVMPLVLKDNPTGIIICGEGIAPQVNYYLGLMKIDIPNDISVITSENNGYSRWFNPPHTTMDQDIPGIATKLIEIANNMNFTNYAGPAPRQHLVPCNLNIRKSVKRIN